MHRISTTLLSVMALATLAACAGGTGDPASSTPMATPSEAASPGPTETATMPAESPTTTPTQAPSPTDASAFADPRECENPELGYDVEYPAEWWANERIEPSEDDPGFTPIVACTYFAPEPVELQPNAGLPSGIAIQFGLSEDEPIVSGEVLDEEAVSVDGLDAVRRVEQPQPSPGFIPEGSLIYRYVIELDGGYLVASTDNILQDDEAYEESKPILDAMMETLDIDD